MPYEFLDDVATADVAFRAWGGTLEETFVAAATAVIHVMVENPDAIQPGQERQITAAHDPIMPHTLGHIVLCRTVMVALLASCSLKVATRPHPDHAACNVCGGGSGRRSEEDTILPDERPATGLQFCCNFCLRLRALLRVPLSG